MGRKFDGRNLAVQFGRRTSHAKSRGFLPCPPVPLCFAYPMSHFLFLASATFPTAKLAGQPPPPPPKFFFFFTVFRSFGFSVFQ